MKQTKQFLSLILVLLLPLFLSAQDMGNYQITWSSQAAETDVQLTWDSGDATVTDIVSSKNVCADVDLDQDGKREFILPVMYPEGEINKRSIYVFEAQGNDDYDMVWTYQFPTEADGFVTVDVSDLDGDGKQEILAIHTAKTEVAAPEIYIFEWDGTDNGYGTAPTITWDLRTPADRENVREVKAADVDADGQQELVLVNAGSNPGIMVASVSGFDSPVWTVEYENDVFDGHDIAALDLGDMDGDGFLEAVATDGGSNTVLIVEYDGSLAYFMKQLDMPEGKSVSVHGIDMADVDGDGRDEAYIANLQGNIYVVTKPTGDVEDITNDDLYLLFATEEQWLDASLGSFSGPGLEFVIAGSRATKVVSYKYISGLGAAVTDPACYSADTIITRADITAIVPDGIRVYGLDTAGDMDGDGKTEIVFTRGSDQGGTGAPVVFIAEGPPAIGEPWDSEDNTVTDIVSSKNVCADVDLDQDGKREFILPVMYPEGEINKRSIYVFEAQGNDDYDMVWTYQFPTEADGFVTVDVSDLDGDGKQEILAIHTAKTEVAAPEIYIFEWDGTDNGYGTAPTITWDLRTPADRENVREVKAADVDADGQQELVLVNAGSNPGIMVASVSGFDSPVWTVEYENDVFDGHDIAALDLGDMDGDGFLEAVATDGGSNTVLIVEYDGSLAYFMKQLDMPEGKSVSVHGIDMADVDGDGRDEAYIANLQGNIYVVTKPTGDVEDITNDDLYLLFATEEQWLDASLGSFSGPGLEFVIAGSRATKVVSYKYISGLGAAVTDPACYSADTIITRADITAIVPDGIRVYGLDTANDMDGDGFPEIVFTRGSDQGGTGAPIVFVAERISFVGIDELVFSIPAEFELLQNYPNPFNPTTLISYSVSQPGKFTLNIYNVLGQKVCTLVNGYHEVNYYSVQWNGTNDRGFQVPSGIYFYRLEAAGEMLMKRMLLMR